jgi:hypothetical protein
MSKLIHAFATITIVLGPATWISAAVSSRFAAVSNPELPLPMISTR